MKIRVFAVIDTNVLVSAAMSSDGFPCDIFDLIETGNVIPIFDKRMLNEYYNVLNYPNFKEKFDKNDIYNILFRTVNYGMMINDVEKAKEELIDRSDIPFFEVKESSEDLESYLVTGNIKHFPKSNSTVTPHTMLGIIAFIVVSFLGKDRQQCVQGECLLRPLCGNNANRDADMHPDCSRRCGCRFLF